jgi:Cyanobacterial and plant NDH-1 subunit O
MVNVERPPKLLLLGYILLGGSINPDQIPPTGLRILNRKLIHTPIIMPVKKGDLVKIVQERFTASVEALASDPRLPDYVFEGKGQVVDLRGDYAQVKFPVPTPNVWLRLDQLETTAP